MNWFKKNPLFCSTLLALAILIIAQIALLFVQYGKLTDSRQDLENLVSERDRLLSREPAPVPENAEIVEEELAAHEELLNSLVEFFADGALLEEFFGTPPSDSSQAFFDITTWRTQTLQKFARAGMIRNPDEINLGFQRHASQVRREEPIEKIHRQRIIVDYLLDRLYEASPETLVRVNRQDPTRHDQEEEAEDSRFRRPQTSVGRTDGDFFEIPPAITLRRPGIIKTEGVRLVFTGQTETLRNFLEDLQDSEYPIFIRNITVEPVETRQRSRVRGDETEQLVRILERFEEEGGPTGGGEIDVSVLEQLGSEERERLRPIIGTVINRFTVTIEFVTLSESGNSPEIPNL
ncbi:MAG: Amuc_1100 family pilus-like protein [Opitutales bacterium]|nr:Amuc_1100 family pilus-like protein [Opitutales bacterium]MCH8540892.1 Amuc_1100 family pilus-like protein [Opitutales bacterium]